MAIIGKTYYGRVIRKNVTVVDVKRDYASGTLQERVYFIAKGEKRIRKVVASVFKSQYSLV